MKQLLTPTVYRPLGLSGRLTTLSWYGWADRPVSVVATSGASTSAAKHFLAVLLRSFSVWGV